MRSLRQVAQVTRSLLKSGAGSLSSSFSTTAVTDAEKQIAEKLKKHLKVTNLVVKDTSGGCGAMYQIDVTAEEFRATPLVKQHQLVHKILKEDIAQWHGYHLTTKTP